MTNKEKEILEIIKNNPAINQNEIASLLDISRSTVAVHISSLMKKGYIKGRYYILNEDEYIVGIGAAIIDIYGKSDIPIRLHYDHPSKIITSVGGVTRNILTNYSKLGGKASIISVVGDDSFGLRVIEDLNSNNIDTSSILISKENNTGVFMQVMDENNDMHLALCDMSPLKEINKEYIKKKETLIKNSKAIVLDPSLSEETIKEIIKVADKKIPIFADPISDNLALNIKDFVGDFYCLKPNKSELESLTDIKINNDEDLIEACKILINKGLEKIFVSLGKDGVLYMDKDNKIIRSKFKTVENMVNASGAGDAMFASIVYGYTHNFELEDIIDYCEAAGISAVISQSTINENLSIAYLKKIIEEYKSEA